MFASRQKTIPCLFVGLFLHTLNMYLKTKPSALGAVMNLSHSQIPPKNLSHRKVMWLFQGHRITKFKRHKGHMKCILAYINIHESQCIILTFFGLDFYSLQHIRVNHQKNKGYLQRIKLINF